MTCRTVTQTIAKALPQRVRRDPAPADVREDASARNPFTTGAVSAPLEVIGTIAAIVVDRSRARCAYAEQAPLAAPDATAANDRARR